MRLHQLLSLGLVEGVSRLGRRELVEIFGHWPAFHDAEVVRFCLDRGPASIESPTAEVDIHVFEMTKDVSPTGHYLLRDHTLVTLRFRGVTELELMGFNGQNALFNLGIDDVTEQQIEGVKYEVTLDSSYGVGATFFCRDAEVVQVRPWNPDTRSPAV